MIKNAANITPIDQAIIKGILDGFGEILDTSKIEKFNTEIKKLFATIQEDSAGLNPATVYQIAFHLARNRAKTLVTKKEPSKSKVEPSTIEPVLKETPSNEYVVEQAKDIDITNLKREEPASLIQRAILAGFGSVQGLTSTTTVEHINDEASKLYQTYIGKADKYETDYQLYDQVSRAAKHLAESIVASYLEIEQKQLRKNNRERKKHEAEQAELERNRISEIAKKELQELINKLLQNADLTSVSKEALRYFKLVYVENKKDPEVVHLFPGTSRDQRYKWKERAVSMIVPLVSEESRKYISEKTKRKYASADMLYRAAQTFLNECQEG